MGLDQTAYACAHESIFITTTAIVLASLYVVHGEIAAAAAYKRGHRDCKRALNDRVGHFGDGA